MLTNWKSSGSNQEQKGLVLTKYYFCIRQDLFVPEALQLVVWSRFLELVRWVAAQDRCEPRRDAWPNDLLVLSYFIHDWNYSKLRASKRQGFYCGRWLEEFNKRVKKATTSIYSFEFPSESKKSKDNIMKIDISWQRIVNYCFKPGNWRLRREARSDIWNASSCHALQWQGSLWTASMRTDCDSETRDKFLSTTPYR